LFWGVSLPFAALAVSGCYQQLLIDAVVDDPDNAPGGSVSAQLGELSIGPLPALASGEPLLITGSNDSTVFAITCGDDVGGRPAHDVLDGTGKQLKLSITSGSRTQVQFHVGGTSCVATSGEVDLLTGLDKAISGTFTATGTVGMTEMPCEISGTLTAIPQYR